MNIAVDIVAQPRLGKTFYPCSGHRLQPQPLVLIHGWGADSQIWGDLPQQLSEWADVITLDLPGFGASEALQHYSADSMLQWMHRALPDQSLLLGLSLGGMLCHRYAATYPQRVSGLILLSSNRQFVADAGY
ncbi:alpha/beta fold hydrolase, partial [Porticoccaceae bacterium]|nr:alpha/beta fold hydrolase [Porticoccaceae bacterium]